MFHHRRIFQLIAPEGYVAEQTQRFYVEHAIASAAPEYGTDVVEVRPQSTVHVNVLDNDQAAVVSVFS